MGVNDLSDHTKTAALHIGQIDVHGKPVPDWSMAPFHADIGAKLIRMAESNALGPVLTRSRTRADINQPTILAKTVENDPKL